MSAYQGHLLNGDGASAAQSHVPTHPDVLEVRFQPGSYNSFAVAKRVRRTPTDQPFSKGEVIGTFADAKFTDTVRYSSVQVGTDRHIELNSECARADQFPVLQPLV